MMKKNNPFKGKHHSEETKEKIRLLLKGREVPAERIKKMKNYFEKNKDNLSYNKPVKQINLESGKVVNFYPSISEASRQTKINGSCIGDTLRGRQKMAGGYKWEYITKEIYDSMKKELSQ